MTVGPTYLVSWDPGRRVWHAQVDRNVPALDAWPPLHAADPEPIRALARVVEQARLWLAGVAGQPPAPWLGANAEIACPVHLRRPPCREPHYTTPAGAPPYTRDPAVIAAAERHQATGHPVDQVLLDIQRERSETTGDEG